jgi:hypothetical protein
VIKVIVLAICNAGRRTGAMRLHTVGIGMGKETIHTVKISNYSQASSKKDNTAVGRSKRTV